MGAFPHTNCAAKVRGIQNFHMDSRGWADIAYNALVCPHGYVFEGRGPGHKSAANGGTQVNDDYYAVCYLSGAGDPFTDAGKQAFLDAFDWLTREGAAGPDRVGHKDIRPEPTACPGPEIYAWVHSPAARHQEEDMTPEQAKQLEDALSWARSARAQALAAHTVALQNAAKLDQLLKADGVKVDTDAIASAVKAGLGDAVADELADRLDG